MTRRSLDHAARRLGSPLLWALLAVFWGSPAGASLPDPRSDWRLVETPHFQILSDAGARRVEELATELESLHALLDRFAAESRPGPRTVVFAFRSNRLFRAYSPWPDRRGVAGFFTRGLLRNLISLDLSSGAGAAAVYHEYLHEFAATNFPGVPLWFNEGLAEYYSTFLTRDGSAEVGRPVERHLDVLQLRSPLPLDQLFAVRHSDPEYNETQRAGVFYAQSWATVHYLLSEPTRVGPMGDFLDALRRGTELRDAFESAFDLSMSELEREIADYLRVGSFPFLRVPLDGLEVPSTRATTADRATALALLGELLATLRSRPADARLHFHEALREQPEQPIATAGLAWTDWQRGAREAALDQLRSAASVSPRAVEPRFVLGLLLLQDLLENGNATAPRADLGDRLGTTAAGSTTLSTAAHDTRTPQGDRRALELQDTLQSALLLEPNWPQAEVALGLSHLFAGSPREGFDRLRRLVPQRPSDPLLRFGLAALAARADAFPEAWQLSEQLDELAQRLPTAQQRSDLMANARDLIAALQVNRAISLINEGGVENEEIASGLAGDLAERLDAIEYRRYAATLEQLEDHLEQRRATATYNRAVELANRGRRDDLAKALELVRQVLQTPSLDPALRQQAQSAADQLEATLADKP